MKLNSSLIAFLLIKMQISVAQPTSSGRALMPNGILQTTSSNFYPINFVDRQGQVIKRGVIDNVKGSPYYDDNWLNAKVTTTKGVIFNDVQLKLHLQANEVHYKNDSITYLIIDTGIIQKMEFLQNGKMVQFESGFPVINRNVENTFYQVLTSGKYTLLKHVEKVLVFSKNTYSGEQDNEFKEYTNYFLFKGNEIILLNKKEIKNIKERVDKEDFEKYNLFIKNNTIKTIQEVEGLFKALN